MLRSDTRAACQQRDKILNVELPLQQVIPTAHHRRTARFDGP